jgi:hypothetical protein
MFAIRDLHHIQRLTTDEKGVIFKNAKSSLFLLPVSTLAFTPLSSKLGAVT